MNWRCVRCQLCRKAAATRRIRIQHSLPAAVCDKCAEKLLAVAH